MDIFNLPDKSKFTQVFRVNSSGSTGWESWSKPKNISFVYILCIGSGGGGGGARGNSANSAGGGGGGGSAAWSTGIFPAVMLPDTLFVSVGRGGPGGAGGGTNVNGTAGSSGELSYVSVTPSTGTTSVLMVNGATVAGGGGGSSSSAAGSLGAAGTIWAYSTSYIFPQLGQITPNAGVAGIVGASATATNGGSVTITGLVTGGAGGAGASAAGNTANGGAITGIGIIPTVVGGTAGSASTVNGNCGLGLNSLTDGYSSRLPLFFTGGSGGASTGVSPNNFTGGRGGDGSYGCGGGGGGGVYNATGGTGGRGGDGLVIITCW